MGWPKRIGIGFVATAALWFGGLALAGSLGAGCIKERLAGRVATSLQAQAKIDELSLSLVRGRLSMRGLTLRRERQGRLDVAVARADAALAPLGAALFVRDLGRVELSGVKVQATTREVLEAEVGGAPLAVEELIVRDARVELSGGVLVPAIPVRVTVRAARAGATVLHTPLSWLLQLRELDAVIELPVGGDVRVRYQDGMLTLAEGMFGDSPLAMQLDLAAPPLPPGTSMRAHELAHLAALGSKLTREVAMAVATRFLKGTPTPTPTPTQP